jgi:hypothetical protein
MVKPNVRQGERPRAAKRSTHGKAEPGQDRPRTRLDPSEADERVCNRREDDVNPDTGEFHHIENEVEALRLRNLGWMELGVGEIIKIKSHDFRVEWIGKEAVVIQSVKVVDPSTKEKQFQQIADRADRERAKHGGPPQQ